MKLLNNVRRVIRRRNYSYSTKKHYGILMASSMNHALFFTVLRDSWGEFPLRYPASIAVKR
ncbi:MAG: hypothetical protein WD735_07270 [Balneolaceae bacterium]